MDVILKNVKKKDLPVLRSLAKALGFEIGETQQKSYDPKMVQEILNASEEIKNGKGKRVAIQDLDKFLGL